MHHLSRRWVGAPGRRVLPPLDAMEPAVDGMDRLWEMKRTEDPETRDMNLVDGCVGDSHEGP
jgi:hypothetical protein